MTSKTLLNTWQTTSSKPENCAIWHSFIVIPRLHTADMSGMQTNTAQVRHFHVIEVSKLGYDFSITHLYRGQVMFTATYEKEMDALRMAAMVGTSEEDKGNEVLMNIRYNRNPGANARW